MVTRIVHISDLHFRSRNLAAADALRDTIVQARPDVLAVTGDLADHPSALWWMGRGAWTEARDWIQAIVDKCPELTVLLLPGNHDVLMTGLSGWCWPAAKAFQKAFAPWQREDVYFLRQRNLTFLTLDTNPVGAAFSAEGKAIARRLRRLKKHIDRHEHASAIRESTRILLMHHHPLPVPFQGRDWLLHTRRVDRLLHFLAEHRVDVVLHGHKHRASWSHLRLGLASAEPCFVETLGAGSAFKDRDADPRGHNFNVVDVSDRGVRHVRQYFKPFESTRFEESERSEAETQLDRLVQHRFRQPYRAFRLTWTLEVDAEGDGRNRVEYEQVVFNRSLATYDIALSIDDVENGEALPYRDLEVEPDNLSGELVFPPLGGSGGRTLVRLAPRPIEKLSARVSVQNDVLNGYALTQREAAERGLTDTTRDYMDLLLTDAVEELRLAVTFPADFTPGGCRLEVLEPHDGLNTVHDTLTSELGPSLAAEGRTLKATLTAPPPNMRYRISWALPRAADLSAAAQGRRTQFEQAYLALVAGVRPRAELSGALADAIVLTLSELTSAIEVSVRERLNVVSAQNLFGGLDLSMMVCERDSTPRPMLRLVYWNREADHKDTFGTLRLGVGEGNAGRAYKTCTVRLYDQRRAKHDPKGNTFALKGGPSYAFLLSLPLVDSSNLPLAVFNVGVSSDADADRLRALSSEDVARIAAQIHVTPRTSLLKAAGLGL
jgi:3',5'-cyclic AMP phosphodiesterase CpdA